MRHGKNICDPGPGHRHLRRTVATREPWLCALVLGITDAHNEYGDTPRLPGFATDGRTSERPRLLSAGSVRNAAAAVSGFEGLERGTAVHRRFARVNDDKVKWALGNLDKAVSEIEALTGVDNRAAETEIHHALDWACKADEYIGRSDEPLMLGLRLARDSAQHQLAETGQSILASVGPVGRRTVVQHALEPVPFLVWRDRADLPVPPPQYDDPRKAAGYDEHLAGEVVVTTFFNVHALLSRNARLKWS